MFKPKRKPTTQSYDVWAKLPGELKNRIYELVLVKQGGIFAGSLWTGSRIAGTKIILAHAETWREPGLLRVSKQIREEASSIHYQVNALGIAINARYHTDYLPAAEWILRAFKYGDATPDLSKLHVAILHATKSNAGVLVAVARIIWGSKTDFTSAAEEVAAWGRVFKIVGGTAHVVKSMMQHLIMLAVVHKAEGRDLKGFREAFGRWTKDFYGDSSARESVRVQIYRLDRISESTSSKG